jgi:hypothetical protein
LCVLPTKNPFMEHRGHDVHGALPLESVLELGLRLLNKPSQCLFLRCPPESARSRLKTFRRMAQLVYHLRSKRWHIANLFCVKENGVRIRLSAPLFQTMHETAYCASPGRWRSRDHLKYCARCPRGHGENGDPPGSREEPHITS